MEEAFGTATLNISQGGAAPGPLPRALKCHVHYIAQGDKQGVTGDGHSTQRLLLTGVKDCKMYGADLTVSQYKWSCSMVPGHRMGGEDKKVHWGTSDVHARYSSVQPRPFS